MQITSAELAKTCKNLQKLAKSGKIIMLNSLRETNNLYKTKKKRTKDRGKEDKSMVKRKTRPKKETLERRNRVANLYIDGIDIEEIARIENVSIGIISRDINTLSEQGIVKKRKSAREKKQEQVQKRRERIKIMYIEKMKIEEIAKLEGVTTDTIESDLCDLQKQGEIIRNRTANRIKKSKTNDILDIEKINKETILQENRKKLKSEFERRTIWAVLRDKIESGNRKAIESYIDKILEVRPKSFSKEDFELIVKYKNVISFAKTGMEKSDREILMQEKKNLLDNEEER